MTTQVRRLGYRGTDKRALRGIADRWWATPANQVSGRYPNWIIDFKNDRYMKWSQDCKLSDIMTLTRTTTATYWDQNGALRVAAIDEPRFDYSNGVRELLMEGFATNYLSYNQWDGALADGTTVNGTGNPASGWTISTAGTLSWTVNSVYTDAQNRKWIDVTVNVTNSTGASVYPRFQVPNLLDAALDGKTWCAHAYVELLSISGGSYVNLAAVETTSGGVYVGESSSAYISAPNGIQRLFAVRTNTAGNPGARLQIGVPSSVPAGTSSSVRLRVCLPQVELGNYPSSPILVAGAARGRAFDKVVLAPELGASINGPAALVVWRGAVDTKNQSARMLDYYANSVAYDLIRQGFSDPAQLSCNGSSSTSTPIELGAVLPGTVGAAFTWDSTGRRGKVGSNSIVGDTAIADGDKSDLRLGGALGNQAATEGFACQIHRHRQIFGWGLSAKASDTYLTTWAVAA